MLIVNQALSALINIIVLVLIPFFGYWLYHRLRHKRRFLDVCKRAGLQLGKPKYLAQAAIVTAVCVVAFVLWSPAVDNFTHKGSPQHAYEGLGLTVTSVAMALIYGMIQTGFCEEFLFRGLIAGALGRALGTLWGNLIQAVIFLLPHVPVVMLAPGLWIVLPLVFAGALYTGWLRIKSESILGPWLLHGALNVTTCLYVAVQTADASPAA